MANFFNLIPSFTFRRKHYNNFIPKRIPQEVEYISELNIAKSINLKSMPIMSTKDICWTR